MDVTEREHEPAESARPSVGPRDQPDAIRPDTEEEPDRKLPPDDEDEPGDRPRPAPP